MFDIEIDWAKIWTDNTTLVVNVVSVLLFLIVGLYIRGRLLDEKERVHSNAVDFIIYASVLVYGTIAATLSNLPISFWGYAIAGMIGPPLTVPIYKGVVANGPQLLGKVLPDWLVKWLLKPAPPVEPKGDNNAK